MHLVFRKTDSRNNKILFFIRNNLIPDLSNKPIGTNAHTSCVRLGKTHN